MPFCSFENRRCGIFITSGTERISQPNVALQIGYHSRRGKISVPSQALSHASEPSTVWNFRKYQDYESKVLLGDLLYHPQTFLYDTERFAMSVIFSAVYGVRLADLKSPIMTEFYAVWVRMLQCERTSPIFMRFCFPALILPDFQPGSLMIDSFPMLHYLPKYLQPWTRLALSLRDRETSLHKAFLRTLQKSCKAGEAPDCFGKMLVEVGPV